MFFFRVDCYQGFCLWPYIDLVCVYTHTHTHTHAHTHTHTHTHIHTHTLPFPSCHDWPRTPRVRTHSTPPPLRPGTEENLHGFSQLECVRKTSATGQTGSVHERNSYVIPSPHAYNFSSCNWTMLSLQAHPRTVCHAWVTLPGVQYSRQHSSEVHRSK